MNQIRLNLAYIPCFVYLKCMASGLPPDFRTGLVRRATRVERYAGALVAADETGSSLQDPGAPQSVSSTHYNQGVKAMH